MEVMELEGSEETSGLKRKAAQQDMESLSNNPAEKENIKSKKRNRNIHRLPVMKSILESLKNSELKFDRKYYRTLEHISSLPNLESTIDELISQFFRERFLLTVGSVWDYTLDENKDRNIIAIAQTIAQHTNQTLLQVLIPQLKNNTMKTSDLFPRKVEKLTDLILIKERGKWYGLHKQNFINSRQFPRIPIRINKTVRLRDLKLHELRKIAASKENIPDTNLSMWLYLTPYFILDNGKAIEAPPQKSIKVLLKLLYNCSRMNTSSMQSNLKELDDIVDTLQLERYTWYNRTLTRENRDRLFILLCEKIFKLDKVDEAARTIAQWISISIPKVSQTKEEQKIVHTPGEEFFSYKKLEEPEPRIRFSTLFLLYEFAGNILWIESPCSKYSSHEQKMGAIWNALECLYQNLLKLDEEELIMLFRQRMRSFYSDSPEQSFIEWLVEIWLDPERLRKEEAITKVNSIKILNSLLQLLVDYWRNLQFDLDIEDNYGMKNKRKSSDKLENREEDEYGKSLLLTRVMQILLSILYNGFDVKKDPDLFKQIYFFRAMPYHVPEKLFTVFTIIRESTEGSESTALKNPAEIIKRIESKLQGTLTKDYRFSKALKFICQSLVGMKSTHDKLYSWRRKLRLGRLYHIRKNPCFATEVLLYGLKRYSANKNSIKNKDSLELLKIDLNKVLMAYQNQISNLQFMERELYLNITFREYLNTLDKKSENRTHIIDFLRQYSWRKNKRNDRKKLIPLGSGFFNSSSGRQVASECSRTTIEQKTPLLVPKKKSEWLRNTNSVPHTRREFKAISNEGFLDIKACARVC